MIALTADTAAEYVRDRGMATSGARLHIEELGWGISNVVLRVSWSGGCVVIKQSLPKLRVEADWPFDRSRTLIEYSCMDYLSQLLPERSVPSVLFVDPDNFAFGMTCAPAGGVLWKQALLDGDISIRASRYAGSLLARIHRNSANDERVRDQFADQSVLIQGRVDPYHLTTAQAHPDLAQAIHAEVDRLLATRRTLVLGDYSPKNTFVYPDRVFVLDFEVAHWGDPAFDVAFCLTHLVLKANRFPDRAVRYLAAARAFWSAYCAGGAPGVAETESAAVREVGCLLLARIDGKSKVEYITDELTKEIVRDLARDIILSDERCVASVLDAIGTRIEAGQRRLP